MIFLIFVYTPKTVRILFFRDSRLFVLPSNDTLNMKNCWTGSYLKAMKCQRLLLKLLWLKVTLMGWVLFHKLGACLTFRFKLPYFTCKVGIVEILLNDIVGVQISKTAWQTFLTDILLLDQDFKRC